MLILLVIPLFGSLSLFFLVSLLKRKWITSLILLLLLVLLNFYAEIISVGGLFLSRASKPGFTVLAYNVHNKGEGYEEKQADIAKLILAESPDVAYLCEFALWRNKQLDSILTDNEYKRYYLSGINCVFYSKYPIDSIAGIHIKEDKKKYSLTNKVHVFIGNDTLKLIGCHLSSSNYHIREGYELRAKEADAIYKSIMEDRHPVIVMGDLNDISGSYAVERIKEAGLKDAWWKGGFGYGATFHDKWLRLRLDHILYRDSKLDLQYVKVIDSDLSDHNAILAGFSFR